jgi:hypothetical protein
MSSRVVQLSRAEPDAPPPYAPPAAANSVEESTARGLREAFAAMQHEQASVQHLFGGVAQRLEGTPRIGRAHALWEEWDSMRDVCRLCLCGLRSAR